ncbi:MAG: phenylalanine--tRNA ligase subunit beta [Candidatus Kapabacteria bacterium]|nr:phenylalanine--tRNA ligase subunit beta [Ignavibacteriota bacterium]MCW5883578.1 phenylalanine--tRNA ligase subunit beta [Candidatus Kapabacteria bacterium]
MKLSLNWLKEIIDFEMTPEQLDASLTMLGIEVEGIENPAKKLDGFFVAYVNEKQNHPDADKLSVCQVTIGGDDLQVICGAPNVDKGQKVVLGTSGAIVPSAGFKLEKRKIRGIESNGMICSQKELELGEDESGIWVLPYDAPVGKSLAEYLGVNDVIFEISVTPNRADCLSHIGIAREIAALNGNKLRMPATKNIPQTGNIENYISVVIKDTDKCPRYTAKLIRNCKIGESPDWLKARLQSLGLRPINSAVDVTNLVLMESGQPLHGFDFDKLSEGKIIVKSAYSGEKFITLDGKERVLDSEMLMICDAEKPIAIGGVMGGENSEITDATTNILIESAYFNPSSIRKTSKKLGLQSDSSYRFERGVDFQNVPLASMRAAELIAELTGGELITGMIDVYPDKIEQQSVNLRFERVRRIIGINIDDDTILNLLGRLNFKIINSEDGTVTISVPTYRVDISMEIDLIEEIARLYNYDNIESDFSSQINFGLHRIVKELSSPSLRGSLRNHYVNAGFTEILTQNQIDPKSIELNGVEAVKLSNPLGEELSLLRTSLINSMLKVINHNIRNGSKNLKLFEIGKVFEKTDNQNSFIPGILENEKLIIALTGENIPLQWAAQPNDFDFYDIKGCVEEFSEIVSINGLKIKQLEKHNLLSPNSLTLYLKKVLIGYFGEVKKSVLKHYDIEQKVFIAEINLSEIYKSAEFLKTYQPISHFPAITRDLAFILSNDIAAGDVLSSIKESGGKFLQDLVLFDVYHGQGIDDNSKSLAFNLTFRAIDRTLKENEIDESLNNIINKIESKYSAHLRKN